MTAERKTSFATDPFRMTMLIFAIIAFMYFTGEVLKPLALSVLLSFALAPATRVLERLGLPRAAAVILTVVLSLGLLGVIGYVVGHQLNSLAKGLPDYQENIETKLRGVMNPGQQSTAARLKTLADEVTAKMERPPVSTDGAVAVQKVEVISRPSFQERLRSATGPYLEFLGVGSFVLILVLFMLMGREELSDRIVGLVGHRQVSLTTRTMEEIGQRISRYLATFALVNSGFGVIIGLGLWMIGAPFAALWGCLAAMLRFIPYVGPAVSFILPLVFSFAHFPGWAKPLEIVVLFAVVEAALTSFLEPVIYGKTTGVSALGLLIAAMFWTWLWGTMGLLLSTPLTVCLAVLGKYVPSLWFFAALLKEETDLKPDVRFYQRLLARDREGAIEIVNEALKQRPRVEVFDDILIAALARTEDDVARDELDGTMQAFVWGVVGEIIESLEGIPDHSLTAMAMPAARAGTDGGAAVSQPVLILGLVADDNSDALALRMLKQLLASSKCSMEIVTDTASSLQVVERVAEKCPFIVIISFLPPEGSTFARYLIQRLRASFSDLPIVVGRWGDANASDTSVKRLMAAGASHVVTSLAGARDRILDVPKQKGPMSSPANLTSLEERVAHAHV
jgi:predicted PurR-regulated permease PerM/CheY-like chemotaxis protein